MPNDTIISVETNSTDDRSKTLDEESESTVQRKQYDCKSWQIPSNSISRRT